MNSRLKTVGSLALFVAVGSMIMSACSVPDHPEQSWFPLRVGQEWAGETIHYTRSGKVDKRTFDTFRAVGDTILHGTRMYNIPGWGFYGIRPDGVYLWEEDAGTPEPPGGPIRLFKYPSYAGERADIPVLFGEDADVISVETVSIDTALTIRDAAVRCHCYKFRLGAEGATGIWYIAPGTGFVRLEAYSDIDGKLKFTWQLRSL